MPFIPHSKEDIDLMLSAIGAENIENLFEEIPPALRAKNFNKIPEGLSEQAVTRLVFERAMQDGVDLNFIGAGAYEHHIPWAIWDIVSRGEYMTSYTPYQAEASQGNLQLIYEYQSMICSLMGMECSNASMYDGATSLAEAVLMAVRAHKTSESKLILILGDLNPRYKEVLETIVTHQKVSLVFLSAHPESRKMWEDKDITAVVIPQPSFLGTLQEVDELTHWAHQQKQLYLKHCIE